MEEYENTDVISASVLRPPSCSSSSAAGGSRTVSTAVAHASIVVPFPQAPLHPAYPASPACWEEAVCPLPRPSPPHRRSGSATHWGSHFPTHCRLVGNLSHTIVIVYCCVSKNNRQGYGLIYLNPGQQVVWRARLTRKLLRPGGEEPDLRTDC